MVLSFFLLVSRPSEEDCPCVCVYHLMQLFQRHIIHSFFPKTEAVLELFRYRGSQRYHCCHQVYLEYSLSPWYGRVEVQVAARRGAYQ